MIWIIFELFLLALCNWREFSKILKIGIWILRDMWKMAIGIFNWWKFIGKVMVWILVKFVFLGLDIYYVLQDLPKIMKNAWKTLTFMKLKKEKKHRNFYKNRSRRSKNRNFETKMDYLKPTGIPKPDEENVEKARSGKKGKQFYFVKITKKLNSKNRTDLDWTKPIKSERR